MGSGVLRVLAYADCGLISGAESVFADLVEDLARRDDVAVGLAAPEMLLAEIDAPLAAFHPIPGQAARLAGLRLGSRRRVPLPREVVAGYDVALVNLPSVELGIRGLALPLPTVGLLHISHRLDAIGFRFGRLRYALARRWIRMADRLLVVDPASRRRAVEELGFADAAVEVVAIEGRTVEPRSRAEARSALGLDGAGHVVGVLGRLVASHKGQDVAVRALAHMAGSGDDTTILALGGEGPDAVAIDRLARELGVGERVRLLGQVDPSLFYAAVDAVAIPSRFEGLPLVALEALGAGRPGVAADVDGLAAVWPRQWLVPADAPEALAQRLSELLAADASANADVARSAHAERRRGAAACGETAVGALRACVKARS